MDVRSRLRSVASVALVSVASFIVTACGAATDEASLRRPGQDGASGPNASTTAVANQGRNGAGNGEGVTVDDRIQKACDLPTAHFAFDSAEVDSGARSTMDALAECFISGPLKGRGMRIIGRTDPRGSDEYNMALGHQRAAAIGRALEQKGVATRRIGLLSHGEMDARGEDERGWAADRSAEIVLGE